MTRQAIRLVGLLTALLVASSLTLAQMAGAATNPPGNNGTVKIHQLPLDSDPHNQPHVDCPFTVSFFGFDQGDVATVTFTAWAPTGKGKHLLTDTVDIGADDNSGGGSSAGFDGEKTYALDFDGIVPHRQQGFHVKLQVTVTSPNSRTPKFNKYKVFWAQPCESSGGTTTTTTGGATTTTTGGTTTTTSGGGGSTTTATPGGPGPSTTVLETTTTGLGGVGGGGNVPSPPPGQGGVMPFTGANSIPVAVAGLLLLLVGAAGVLASRRLRAR
jgi:hypothetical protein